MNFTDVKRKQMDLLSLLAMMLIVLLFRKTLGSYGTGYLAASAIFVGFVWLLVGGGSADSIGKLIRSRKARGQYKNIEKLTKSAMFFQGIMGLAGTLFLIFTAGTFAEHVVKISYCTFLIRMFAPYIFLHSIVCVCKGLLQGENDEKVLVFASWLRVLLFFAFSFVFDKILEGYGQKVSDLLGQEHFSAIYSVLGIILGLLMAEFVILCVLLFLSRRMFRRRHENTDGKKAIESFGMHMRNITVGRAMHTLLMLLELLPFAVGACLIMHKAGSFSEGATGLGDFAGALIGICGIFLLPVCAIVVPMEAKTIGSMKRTERRVARNHFQCGYHFTFAYGILGTCFACGIASVFKDLLVTDNEKILRLYAVIGVFVFILSMYYYLSRLLMRLGWQMIVLGGNLICSVIFGFIMVILLNGLDIYLAFLVSMLVALLVFLIVMSIFAFSQFRVGTDALLQVLTAALVAAGIGLFDFILMKLLMPALGGVGVICLLLPISCVAYFVILVLVRNVKEYELSIATGGTLLRRLGETLRIF